MVLEKYIGTMLGKMALEYYGLPYKMRHLCEEMCELFVAISHNMRHKERGINDEAIAEEICDVLILIDEIWCVYGIQIGCMLENAKNSVSVPCQQENSMHALAGMLIDACHSTKNARRQQREERMFINDMAILINLIGDVLPEYKEKVDAYWMQKRYRLCERIGVSKELAA